MQGSRTITIKPIERYEYSELTVRLSCLLYTRMSCGLRQIVKALKVINEVFDGILGKIPCYNTIDNWVKKCGLKSYEASGTALGNTDYAEIVDESMMIGEEKLLLTVGVPASHQKRPLKSEDAQILDIAVAKSWNGENVGKQLKKAAEKVGHPPNYVISDNASIMNKGVRKVNLKHHHDISHSLGMYLERTYKDQTDFKNYVKMMSKAKAKYNMTNVAYLLPPTQRTISRFINLSDWVKWSSQMLSIYHSLSSREKEVFSFIPANGSLIDELLDVIKCIEAIEYICKQKGLSEKSVRECQKTLELSLYNGNQRMIELGKYIQAFLREESKLLINKSIAHNNSSDIIESLFGKYKERKSPNKLYGVTSYILFMPLYTRLSNVKNAKCFNFKTTLEEMRINKLKEWRIENTSPNLVSKRTQVLQKAG